MDKRKKGFTLIELLAVIVILAIIALIAVPQIIDIIAKARKSAFQDSVYGIIRAGEMYYTNELLESGGMSEDKEFIIENGKFEGDKLPISGSLPNSGKIKVTADGDVALVLSDGEYYVQKSTTESEFEVKSLKEDNMTERELDYKKSTNPVFTTTADGKEIPECINDNTPCDVTAAGDDGIKVGVKVNDSETKDFYVISEDAEKGTITLIMNQTLDNAVAWINKADYISAGGTETEWNSGGWSTGGNEAGGNNNKGPITALNYLESETSSWTNIPLEPYTLTDSYYSITRTARARMLKYSEATDLGCTDTEDECPTWLLENITGVANSGYWLSSTAGLTEYSAYGIIFVGWIYETAPFDLFGVRPVITVSKTVL